jgi:hypothetical protein
MAENWLAAIRRYLLASAAGHLVWEVAQLPFFSLWHDASAGQIAWSVLHCTAGDLAIASVTLTLALALAGHSDWPGSGKSAIVGIVIPGSIGYTAYSEYINTVVRQSWAYSDMMPTLLGIGLLPLAQWVVVPGLSLAWACWPQAGPSVPNARSR